MLKSTYKPSPGSGPAPLLPGWTEHDAPSGHKYYYNAATKESTYTRPTAPVRPDPSASFAQYQAVSVPNMSDPNVANAYMAQFQPQTSRQHQFGGSHRGGHGQGGGRGGGDARPKPQPRDRPISKAEIPGCEPWILVHTKYGRRFAYNPAKNASFWRIPEKLKAGILELDKQRIRQKSGVDDLAKKDAPAAPAGGAAPGAAPRPAPPPTSQPQQSTAPDDGDSSEYEEVEVEVTDDEAEGEDGQDFGDGEHASKRQRTEEAPDDDMADAPAEFSEADIAFQLQAMGADYGLEPGEYDDGNPDAWPEGAEGVEFSEEDARALFRDLLDHVAAKHNISPYISWDRLVEDGHLVAEDDGRYTILNTMKARKDCFQEWSKDRIRELKERRAREEKKDPRIAYMALLQDKADPKLFWAEFKRKMRKDPAMVDARIKDKDREKWYREHINRLKMPESKLKTDLAALMKSIPATALNNSTTLEGLPPQMLADPRYISLKPHVRDPLIQTYIQTLGPAPEGGEAVSAEEEEAARKAKEAREKRNQALREHEARVAEQKRRQQRDLHISRARLREEEREIEMAMRVDKRGLQSQLAALRKPSDGDEKEEEASKAPEEAK